MITRKDKVNQIKKEIELLDESMRISDNGKRHYLREKEIFNAILNDYNKQSIIENILTLIGIIIIILILLRISGVI